MRIAGSDPADRVLVIAEIGNNHEGDPAVARELIGRAAQAGADAVKLQTYEADRFVRPHDEARLAQLRRFELAPETVAELAAAAREEGVAFVSTPLDVESVELLEPLADALKIASGDNDFAPLIERVGATGLPVIVSLGLADMEAARAIVAAVRLAAGGGDRVAALHCVSAYPVEPSQARLAAIPALAAELDCVVGYSDHTVGLDAAVLAVAAGARIVEKHVTLDHHFSEFRDHQLSAEPAELAELVRRIREAEELLGAPGKDVEEAEAANAAALRRSIVARRDLPAGHVVAAGDLTWMRRDGLAPGREGDLLGRALGRPVARGDALTPDLLA